MQVDPWMLAAVVLALALLATHLGWRRRGRGLQERLVQAEGMVATFQRERENASEEASVRQEALFDSMSEGVLLLDAEGRIQLLNRSLKQMFDLKRDMRGRTVLEAFRLRELNALMERMKDEVTVSGVEIELPGIEEHWMEVNAAAIRDTRGNRLGWILVFHDLTRIKQLENTRQEFVANVSHELRTPLSLIKGYVETLLDGAIKEPPLAAKFLRTIEKHTDRLTFLIEDILTISKLESGQIVMNRDLVDLHDHVQRVLDDLENPARERGTRTDNGVPLGLRVRADADRLEQVFFNLVENAIKYGASPGQVRVGAKDLGGGRAQVWVEDDGPGIPKEAQHRVFERFYRVDRARSRETGGTGLGLSIVKHIVQAHGGEVWVRSENGRGTGFFFTLPT